MYIYLQLQIKCMCLTGLQFFQIFHCLNLERGQNIVIFTYKGLSRVFSKLTVQMHQFFGAQVSLWSNSHDHTWLLEKQKLNYGWIFVGKVMSLLFTMLSRLVIIFLPKSRRLLISWLKLLSVVILVPKQIKSVTVSIVSQSNCKVVLEKFSEIQLWFRW